MISFPNCKINLGLNIVAKRTDGYHDLETVFYPVYLKDILEVIQEADFKYSSTGLQINGKEGDNLCVKAYKILKKDFPQLPNVHIHLHKVIPMGAGLGGGSADGAFLLTLLNKKFHLDLTEEQLINYALQLGSDCPFFIINKPCFATGRGEQLKPIHLDLSSYHLVLVNPGIHVSTKAAFSQLMPHSPANCITEVITKPVETWKGLLKNDFEETVFKLHPEVKAVKEELYKKGAEFASMTGTGSTVYGFFKKEVKPSFTFPADYLVLHTTL
jgi:4-diphosphocytidyl-2-C-methyl-D-erythritol kinase